MARTDRFIQKIDALMDRTEMQLQNHDATLKSLEAQGATHEQCKAITTRSGKILMQTNNQRGTAASPSAATDKPVEVDEPAETSEDHYDPHSTSKGESSAESSHTKPDKSEDIRPPPPFPQRMKKQKQDYQFKKFFDILKQDFPPGLINLGRLKQQQILAKRSCADAALTKDSKTIHAEE
ncbi:hypothetical protein GQ457_09G018580 [Hibiscus cannabinus]